MRTRYADKIDDGVWLKISIESLEECGHDCQDLVQDRDSRVVGRRLHFGLQLGCDCRMLGTHPARRPPLKIGQHRRCVQLGMADGHHGGEHALKMGDAGGLVLAGQEQPVRSQPMGRRVRA